MGARLGNAPACGEQAVGRRRRITELHRTASVLLNRGVDARERQRPQKHSILPSLCGWRGDDQPNGALLHSVGVCALAAPGDGLVASVGEYHRVCLEGCYLDWQRPCGRQSIDRGVFD